MIFGLPGYKDEVATSAFDENGIVQRGIKKVKELCQEYVCNILMFVCVSIQHHGHCGIIHENEDTIDNDATLEYIAKIAVSHAKAGADMVAPSDMMDGRVLCYKRWIR